MQPVCGCYVWGLWLLREAELTHSACSAHVWIDKLKFRNSLILSVVSFTTELSPFPLVHPCMSKSFLEHLLCQGTVFKF